MSAIAVAQEDSSQVSPGNGNIGIWCASLLVLSMCLLPMDHGAPPIVKGITTSEFVSIGTFLVVLLTSGGKVLQCIRHPFMKWQLAFVLFGIPMAFTADPKVGSLQWLPLYACVFVLDAMVILYLIEEHGYRWLVRSAITGCTLAALIGIAETVLFIRLPFYQKMYDAANVNGGFNAVMDAGRSVGTMGNPIYVVMLMIVGVPYAFNLRSIPLRLLVLAALFFGAVVTISRTAGIAVAVFIVGCAFIYGRRFWKVMGVSILILVVILISPMGASIGADPRVQVWSDRVGLGSTAGEAASTNVDVREQASVEAIKEMRTSWEPTDFVLGRGPRTTAKFGEEGQYQVDNAPVTLLYENGLVGLFCFGMAYFLSLWRTRAKATKTLHWYNAIAVLLCGLSMDFYLCTTFNVLLIGSLMICWASPPEGFEFDLNGALLAKTPVPT